jgi:hypothetical protein
MSQEYGSREPNAWAVGFIAFAAFMLIMGGFFHAISGLVGVLEDELYVVTPDYVFQLDITTWGWINLIGGIIAILAGFYLFTGAVWARTVGVIVALASAVVSFAWIPYYPIWSIIVIAVDMLIIWALVAHGRDISTD